LIRASRHIDHLRSCCGRRMRRTMSKMSRTSSRRNSRHSWHTRANSAAPWVSKGVRRRISTPSRTVCTTNSVRTERSLTSPMEKAFTSLPRYSPSIAKSGARGPPISLAPEGTYYLAVRRVALRAGARRTAFFAGALLTAFLAEVRLTAFFAGERFAAFLAGALFTAFLAAVRLTAFLAGALFTAFFAGARFTAFFAGARFTAFLAEALLFAATATGAPP